MLSIKPLWVSCISWHSCNWTSCCRHQIPKDLHLNFKPKGLLDVTFPQAKPPSGPPPPPVTVQKGGEELPKNCVFVPVLHQIARLIASQMNSYWTPTSIPPPCACSCRNRKGPFRGCHRRPRRTDTRKSNRWPNQTFLRWWLCSRRWWCYLGQQHSRDYGVPEAWSWKWF